MEEAKELQARIAEVIVRDWEVREVYDPDGHYIPNFWYTPEAPFTWSAGMLNYTYHLLGVHQQPTYNAMERG